MNGRLAQTFRGLRARENVLAVDAINSSGHKGIKWDTEPLGSLPDTVLAARLGVTSVAVRKARTKRGIPTFFRSRWCGVGLGDSSDKDIAQAVGVSRRTVSRARQRFGLHGPRTIDWDKQPLGKLPDAEWKTRVLLPQDLNRYDFGQAPEPRHLISCSGCGSIFGKDRGLLEQPLRHHARGFCRSCYWRDRCTT